MSNSLNKFVFDVTGQNHLRVEQDLGDGFVRLRISEAERRQAIQDIRSSEDIVLELLRNSRDANSKHIFLALSRNENERTITVIDDGDGIPSSMHETIFEPRVTSKLNTSHIDKWGYHGRGMALYSISANADSASVLASEPGKGTALQVRTDLTKLGERKDQSTFPSFIKQDDNTVAVRGPKNILRVACEFAIEVRNECSIYVGSPTEVAAVLYEFGNTTISSSIRAFTSDISEFSFIKRLSFSDTPASFSQLAEELGLEMSERSARRIMDGEVLPASNVLDQITIETETRTGGKSQSIKKPVKNRKLSSKTSASLSGRDIEELTTGFKDAFDEYASRYYLESDVKPKIRISNDELIVTYPLVSSE